MNDIYMQIKEEIDCFAAYLPSITVTNPAEFEQSIRERLDRIDGLSFKIPAGRDELMHYCWSACAYELDKSIMQSHSRHKPIGYPGDYMIIDYIYTRRTVSPGAGALWDEFYHRQSAPRAVRNRKRYLRDTFARLSVGKPHFSMLNIASGPCRDVVEAVEHCGEGQHIHCVDMDPNAIEYAKELVEGRNLKASLSWEAANALSLRPHRRYDLVWSAGLFDYLDDLVASRLLKRMWEWTKPGGSAIFGNFSPVNPSRNSMEWTLNWFLIHRDETAMRNLCIMAGIPDDCVTVEKEPLGVNLFCVARKIYI